MSLIRELDAGEAMPATQTKGARAETLKYRAGLKGEEDAVVTSALSADEWQSIISAITVTAGDERANNTRPQKNSIQGKAHSDDAGKDGSKKEPSSKLDRWASRTGQGTSGGGMEEVHNLSSHMADAARGVDKDAAQSIAIESLSRQEVSSCVGGGGGDQSRTTTVEINRNPGAPDEVVGIGLTFGRLPGKWDGPCEISGFVPGGNAGASGKLRPGDLIHEVMGTNIYKLSDAEVRRLIMGVPGTKLTLKVSNEKEPETSLIPPWFRTWTVEINRNSGTTGQVVGIGLTFGRRQGQYNGPCKVLGFVPGGNVGASGKLKPGDLIHEVAGTNIYKLSDAEIRLLVLGVPGTQFTLKVSSENEAPAAPTIGLKWEEIPNDRLWMCTQITHAALAAALERKLEFSNHVIQLCTHASKYERGGRRGGGGERDTDRTETDRQTDRQTYTACIYIYMQGSTNKWSHIPI